jgi:antitoxin VapB
LQVEDDRAERLARELARLTGEDVSRAVVRAIEERLARERGRGDLRPAGLAAKLLALGDGCARLPVLDEWDGDAILYDDDGLPKTREAV